MPYNGFVPSEELQKFEQEHGEDSFIMMNLLYAAFEMGDLFDPDNDEGEFDELCDDVVEMFLDDQFENFTVVDVADGVMYIISDSNYTVRSYTEAYRRHKDRSMEELLAFLTRDDEE